jgi:hypothetical protein
MQLTSAAVGRLFGFVEGSAILLNVAVKRKDKGANVPEESKSLSSTPMQHFETVAC